MLWGLVRQGLVSVHGKIQQLELRQTPPENIPAKGGFSSRVKGKNSGISCQRNEARARVAVLAGSPAGPTAPTPSKTCLWMGPAPQQRLGMAKRAECVP